MEQSTKAVMSGPKSDSDQANKVVAMNRKSTSASPSFQLSSVELSRCSEESSVVENNEHLFGHVRVLQDLPSFTTSSSSPQLVSKRSLNMTAAAYSQTASQTTLATVPSVKGEEVLTEEEEKENTYPVEDECDEDNSRNPCIQARGSGCKAYRKRAQVQPEHPVKMAPRKATSESSSFYADVVSGDSKAVNILRMAVLVVLMMAAALVSLGVHFYTKNEETTQFEEAFENHAHRLIDSFRVAVERQLTAINSLATAITSYALGANATFPFVTLPDFAVRGSDSRILADAMLIHYMPLVTDDNREKWEEYALKNRFHIDEAFELDQALRLQQDEVLRKKRIEVIGNDHDRELTEAGNSTTSQSILQDGSGFHTKIWAAPTGDEPIGSGPFIPLWQRSPINVGKQIFLNWNFEKNAVFSGMLPRLLETKQAIMNRAATVTTPEGKEGMRTTLNISQYRHEIRSFIDEPMTYIGYPVFDSFDPNNREIGGILATTIHWKVFFEQILPPSAHDIICVIENSYNQTLTFMVDGNIATFLGHGDLHDPQYDYMEESADINTLFKNTVSAVTQSYTTVPLSEEYGQYKLRIYPSQETEKGYRSNDPVIYTVVVAAVFLFTSAVFISFACVVERRQQAVLANAMKNAKKAANTERELNEFLSHEVRNPLSAAISACSFVSSAVNGPHAETSTVDDFKLNLKDDMKVIQTCLLFVNDFLKSMLDLHRAAIDNLEFHLTEVNILREVIDPVCTMLYQRNFSFLIKSGCASDLVVVTDRLRLKQILLNLVVNSSKFVKTGFIRLRAAVVDGLVELYVEDSGPGIAPEKRRKLFEKYENRLDEMNQGMGIGLGLSKCLITSLNGDMKLDETYNSGIEGSPGARFVVQLKKPPVIPPRIQSPSPKLISDSTFGTVPTTKDNVVPVELQLPPDLSVLFVDDDTILRKLFVRAVTRVAPNWKIQQAPDGFTAVQLAEADPRQFHIIFMDQYMPSTQKTLLGTETIQELRAKGVECRICGLSANDLEGEFMAAGADFFSVKPIPCDEEELKQWLLDVIGV